MQTTKSLKPQSFKEYIGQERLKRTLKVMISSAMKRNVMCDHILLHGKPGIGKTSLAYLIGKKMKLNIRFAQGPLLEKKSDILSLFSTIQNNEILFIDEFHGINNQIEELIYSALEEGVVDIPIGVEGELKIIRMKLPNFTLIGATTKIGKISEPLKERFGIIGKLIEYNEKEMVQILQITAKKLNIELNNDVAMIISSRSKKIPRVANNLLKRCKDFALVNNNNRITKAVVVKTFAALGVYKYGLTDQHLDYMKTFFNIFEQHWTSLESLSGITGESKENIESSIEPELLTNNLMVKSSRGRKLTKQAIEYLIFYNLIQAIENNI